MTTPNTSTANQCKANAELAISRAFTVSKGPYQREDQAILIAEAQVWATLAAIPDTVELKVDKADWDAGDGR